MSELTIYEISDETMGERDWMVLVVRETGRIILAVKRSARLAVDALESIKRAVDAARASLLAPSVAA